MRGAGGMTNKDNGIKKGDEFSSGFCVCLCVCVCADHCDPVRSADCGTLFRAPSKVAGTATSTGPHSAVPH